MPLLTRRHCASICAPGKETLHSPPAVVVQMTQVHKGAQVYMLLLKMEKRWFRSLCGFFKYVNTWFIIEIFTLLLKYTCKLFFILKNKVTDCFQFQSFVLVSQDCRNNGDLQYPSVTHHLAAPTRISFQVLTWSSKP